MEWTTAASLALRVGKGTYDNRHIIQKYWTTAKAYLDVGKTQVVVTGRSNAGKSLLVAHMHGRARDLSYELPSESRTVEVDAIPLGEWTKLVRVLPGQPGRREHGEIEAFEDNGDLEGVIHVVDFGYVKPREQANVLDLVRKGVLSIDDLRRVNLEEETYTLNALLSDIRKSLAKHKRPKWLLVAVNKVDLFPQQRQEALNFYHPLGTSRFSSMLKEFVSEVGSKNFEVFVAQACAHEIAFEWNGHTVPTKLLPQEQMAMLRDFMRTVATITHIHS